MSNKTCACGRELQADGPHMQMFAHKMASASEAKGEAQVVFTCVSCGKTILGGMWPGAIERASRLDDEGALIDVLSRGVLQAAAAYELRHGLPDDATGRVLRQVILRVVQQGKLPQKMVLTDVEAVIAANKSAAGLSEKDIPY